MKKFFIALSVLAALFLTVAPSQALIGMPDDVPGMNLLHGFFIVEVGTTGLDTLCVFQEVGGQSPGGTATNELHWRIFTQNSVHLKDRTVTYTPYDVVSWSVRDLIANVLNDADRALLQTTLGGRDVYIGYLTVTNEAAPGVSAAYNNMLGKTYLVDLAKGKGCMDNTVAYEYMPDATQVAPPRSVWPGNYSWLAAQYQRKSYGASDAEFTALANPWGVANVEGLNAAALAASEQREGSGTLITDLNVVAPSDFWLLPRFYLFDANAENYIFLWKSRNHTGAANATVEVTLYDTEENPTSAYITIPDELNIIDVMTWLPDDFKVTYPTAGWIDIHLDATSNLAQWDEIDWVGYNLQMASNSASSLNWSSLNAVPRWVWWTGK